MLFVTGILLVLSAIIYFNNPRGSSNRWGAGFAFVCSLGTLGRVLEYGLSKPLLSFVNHSSITSFVRDLMMSIGYWCGIYYAPYFILKFGLLSSGIKTKKYIDIFLNIPIVATIVLSQYPIGLYSPNYRIILLYVVPYSMVGAGVMLYSAYHEIHYRERHSKLLASWLVAIIASLCCAFNYISPAFGWKINDWLNFYFVILIFVIFVIAAYFYGNFGVRIKFENINHSSIEAVNTGASLMNHAIKNELALISQSINAIERKLEDVDAIKKNLERIKISTGYLLSFINQIQEQIKPDPHVTEPINLATLMEESINMSWPLIEEKNIHITKKIEGDWFISGDRRLILEVFNNLIANAIEAVQQEGVLKISIYSTRFSLMVNFEDNGCGIPKEHLSHVIEPFFSTKHLSHNYGLGLTFCYNVARDHGGSLEIQSEPKKGTHVTVKFPKTLVTSLTRTGPAIKQ